MTTLRTGGRMQSLLTLLALSACVGAPPPSPPGNEDSPATHTSSSASTDVTDDTTSPPSSPSPSTSIGTADGSSTSNTTVADASSDDSTGGPPPTCADDNGGCDPNATCNDDSGRVTCTCNPGYEGDGIRCSVDASLPMLRIEVPCGQESCAGFACEASNSETDIAMLTGDPSVTYAVTLRIRGVVEEQEYMGGIPDGTWYEGGDPVNNVWNSYSLTIASPYQLYYLNSGQLEVTHCIPLDYERTISVLGQSTVTLTMNDANACSTFNQDEGGAPLVIPGIPPAPDPFDGQFVQIDVVSIEPSG